MQVQNGTTTPLLIAQHIYRNDGVVGFFRGNGANVIKIVPEASIRFWAHDQARLSICADPSQPSPCERLGSGAIAGATSCLSIYPLELAKTRIAVSSAGQYSSIFDCIHRTVMHEGIGALYKGLPTALVGIIPYSAIDLGLYETAKASLRTRRGADELGVADAFVCGALATCSAQVCTYPLALAKTRLQTSGMMGYAKYDGLADCLCCAVRAEGWRGLFRGFVPNLMKAVPSMSITYAVFETTKSFLLRHDTAAP
jgi:solute carrier family 25 phosphate transporter 23/24/25/41